MRLEDVINQELLREVDNVLALAQDPSEEVELERCMVVPVEAIELLREAAANARRQ